MRLRAKGDTFCVKCHKTIKKGRMISEEGLCYRCDENKNLRAMHLRNYREKKIIKWLQERV